MADPIIENWRVVSDSLRFWKKAAISSFCALAFLFVIACILFVANFLLYEELRFERNEAELVSQRYIETQQELIDEIAKVGKKLETAEKRNR
jgi:hypothetical protein